MKAKPNAKPREEPFKDMHPDDALQWGGRLSEQQISILLQNPFSLLRKVIGFAIAVIVEEEKAKQFLAVWQNIVEQFQELMAVGKVQEIDDPTEYNLDMNVTSQRKVFSLLGEMGFDVNKNLQELQKSHTALLNRIANIDSAFFNTMQIALPHAAAAGRQSFNDKTKIKTQKLENRKARIPDIQDKINMFNSLIANPIYDQNPIVIEGQHYTKEELKKEVEKLEEEKMGIYEKEKRLQERIEVGEKFFSGIENLDPKGLEKLRDHESAKNIVRDHVTKIDETKKSGLTGEHLEKKVKEFETERNEKLIDAYVKVLAKEYHIDESKEHIVKEAFTSMVSSKGNVNIAIEIARHVAEREQLTLQAESLKATMSIQKATFGSVLNNANKLPPHQPPRNGGRR